ncbi:hypothetical protein GCM10009006_35550 [Haloarcula argentinensis]|uniref:Uncharacterized protein n=1 Tax=Haloarcula argentinensis TaxID=43776 RepID=A0A830FXE4_HALAR|nr:hypothetical protein GCM10009006_35550 [Haloarcula argentinensis]
MSCASGLVSHRQAEIAEGSVLAKNTEMRADGRRLEDFAAAPAGVGPVGMLGQRAINRTVVVDGDKEQVRTTALRYIDIGIERSVPRRRLALSDLLEVEITGPAGLAGYPLVWGQTLASLGGGLGCFHSESSY